ncbi:hypothetical protein PAXRUDRAFT_825267 [Paxillus rubicundulus Ve08.2h10]|uniref:Uncharacterized protein n=1 Tax=Paxillus rubicundulus Ve08.2h10 TaxID=930991 RepID=A0A0D0E6H4_9AGAM|nr:hypothetical protein PAXRUDRAFT_825267 [Paxillus rubicundulus Ve08.2h10]
MEKIVTSFMVSCESECDVSDNGNVVDAHGAHYTCDSAATGLRSLSNIVNHRRPTFQRGPTGRQALDRDPVNTCDPVHLTATRELLVVQGT